MEKWEYETRFVSADVDNPGVLEYLQKTWPGRKLPKHAPQTMNPELNALGEAGWELVHMEPIRNVGPNQDFGNPLGITQSHVYFCVFKRRKSTETRAG